MAPFSASPTKVSGTSTTTFSPDVLDDREDRVTLDLLGQGEDGLLLAVDVDLEQRVSGAEGQEDLLGGQRQVHGVGAVAVEDGGGLAGAAQAARGALAELGADLGGKRGVSGHVGVSSSSVE
jgi:hypothetical protein